MVSFLGWRTKKSVVPHGPHESTQTAAMTAMQPTWTLLNLIPLTSAAQRMRRTTELAAALFVNSSQTPCTLLLSSSTI